MEYPDISSKDWICLNIQNTPGWIFQEAQSLNTKGLLLGEETQTVSGENSIFTDSSI